MIAAFTGFPGLLCFEFARALCTGCGQGFVVAFSCKGRGRKSTRTSVNGLVELSPFEFLDRLADRPARTTPRAQAWAKLMARVGCQSARITGQ